MSDKKAATNYCQTKKRGRPQRFEAGTSERVIFRLRRGIHDEVLDVLDALPERARSAWVVNALLCYVRGEIRDVAREVRAISEELGADLFSMFQEDDDGESETVDA